MSRRQPDPKHVVMDANTQEFWCRHCGARHKPALPMLIRDFVNQSKAFATLHARCPSPAAEAVPP